MNNEKKDAFAAYHIKQSLGLACTGLALGLIGMISRFGMDNKCRWHIRIALYVGYWPYERFQWQRKPCSLLGGKIFGMV